MQKHENIKTRAAKKNNADIQESKNVKNANMQKCCRGNAQSSITISLLDLLICSMRSGSKRGGKKYTDKGR